MATRVAETCRWLLCNKTTFIQSSAPVGIFKKLNIAYERMEHGIYETKNMTSVSVCCSSSDEPLPKPVSISGEVLAHRSYCAIALHVVGRRPLTS
jgi:hypothetical protein